MRAGGLGAEAPLAIMRGVGMGCAQGLGTGDTLVDGLAVGLTDELGMVVET
jgi:hypothetical protein